MSFYWTLVYWMLFGLAYGVSRMIEKNNNE